MTRDADPSSSPEEGRATSNLPPELTPLVGNAAASQKDLSWEQFIEKHSLILLDVAHSLGNGYDGALEHYTYVLEQLRADDFKRLRGYAPNDRTKFTTWLVVVARRLCLDNHRRRYGRFRSDDGEPDSPEATRRRLAEFLADQIDVADLPVADSKSPERDVRTKQLADALASALSTLQPEDRLLLRLRYQDEVHVRQIAELMEMRTVFHVYRRVNKLLKQLRASLHDRGVNDPWP